MNFLNLVGAKAGKASKAAGSLKAGDLVEGFGLRGDGGRGLVLKLGRLTHSDGSYGSRKNPVKLVVDVLYRDGRTEQQRFDVVAANGVHLGEAVRSEVEGFVGSVKSFRVVSVE